MTIPNEMITRKDLDRKAWATIEGVRHPVKLLDHYESWNKIRVLVRTLDGTKPFIDHQAFASDTGWVFKEQLTVEEQCTHDDMFLITLIDDPGGAMYACPDCGAWFDDNGDIVRYRPKEIPY